MTSQNAGLAFEERKIGEWDIPTIQLVQPDHLLHLPIKGYIVNSITENKDGLRNWKVHVASNVKDTRGGNPWNPKNQFAITIGFSFNINSGWHGYRPLDVENFLKPVVDALTAGLFCAPQANPQNIEKWDYDDSNFNTLLIHRLPDARTRAGEGIAISISAKSAV